MKITSEKTLSALNDLVEICKDGQLGFRTAAGEAKDAELARIFTEYTVERTGFIAELQDRIRSLGADPETAGTVSGSLHRGWIDMKAAIASNEAHAVLAECERGEDAAVKAYRESLEENLDPISRGIISRQYAAVQAAHDRIKQLRDSLTYTNKR